MLIVLIVVVVVFKRRGGGSSSAYDSNIVSFENPMYDEATRKGTEATNEGLYDQPRFGMGEEGAGYQDVAPGAEQFSMPDMPLHNDGYMDVTGNGGAGMESGYMDVAPIGEEDA